MFHSELGFINLNFDFFKKGFGLRQEELGASSRRAWSFIKKSLVFINKSFSFASLRLSLQTDCPLFDLTLWWLLCPTLFQLLLSFFCALRTMRGAKLIIFCLFATFLLFFLSNVTEKDATN
jgi:succinate-acetate transporter protein